MPGDILFADRLAEHLEPELGDKALARQLAAMLEQDALSWRPPEIARDQVRTIFAFTFGNRIEANGNRVPGPVNERLAECAATLHRRCGAPIFAQWEVAAALQDHMPADAVTPIYPRRDARGEPVYLGTTAVVAEIAARLGPPDTTGPVGVVAFFDHQQRAIMAAQRLGFDARAPAGLPMPNQYDPQSGQAWCRSRLGYLLHDIMLRVADRRAEIVGSSWD